MASKNSTEQPSSDLLAYAATPPCSPQSLVADLAVPEAPAIVVASRKRDYAEEQRRADERRRNRLFDETMALEAEDAKSSGNLGFVAKWMVHATLPYVQPKGNPPAWGRRSGNVSLNVVPGYYQREVEKVDARGRKSMATEPVSYGYPYGAYPRLILAWIATEVAKKKQRDLVMGESLTEFMTTIGKNSITGGKRGTITLLKDQMQRLVTATISVTTDPNASQRWQHEGFQIADSAELEIWWDPLSPAQGSLWQSELRLSEKFFQTLVKNPVPVDLRIITALSRSAMAIDIYSWLTYRNATLERSVKIQWESLMQQFGSGAANKYKFRETFEKNLKDVLSMYPAAKVSTDTAGLLLFPSPPSIQKITA